MSCGHAGCTCGEREIADRDEAVRAHGCGGHEGGHGSGGCCGDRAEPASREVEDAREQRPADA